MQKKKNEAKKTQNKEADICEAMRQTDKHKTQGVTAKQTGKGSHTPRTQLSGIFNGAAVGGTPTLDPYFLTLAPAPTYFLLSERREVIVSNILLSGHKDFHIAGIWEYDWGTNLRSASWTVFDVVRTDRIGLDILCFIPIPHPAA